MRRSIKPVTAPTGYMYPVGAELARGGVVVNAQPLRDRCVAKALKASVRGGLRQ
jgi:hypothetical protein